MNWEEFEVFFRSTHSTPNDATMEYVRNLYAHSKDAKCVMEIGVGPEAASGKTFAAAMGEGGTLFSLDIDEKRPTQEQRDVIESLGVTWEVYHGDTLHSNFAPGRVLDLLYIDGNHDNEHIANDYGKWHSWVKRGGYIIFDDCRDGHPPVDGNCMFFEYDPPHKNGHYIYIVP
jgi:predicted O-methyltransferase YrrM